MDPNLTPSREVADAVAAAVAGLRASTGDLTEADLVDALRATEDAKAQLASVQADLTRTLDVVVRARHTEAGLGAKQRGRDVAALVGYARRLSPSRAREQLRVAHALTSMPQTAAAYAEGAVSEQRVGLIARETAGLSPARVGWVDDELARPDADGKRALDGWGDRRLTSETQRLVAAADPDAIPERHRQAAKSRHVTLRQAADGMARLSVPLPAEQGLAVHATLTRDADKLLHERAAAGVDDDRSRAQVMVDLLVERVTGQETATRVPVAVNLVVSDQTLFEGGSEPGWLQDYGPLHPQHARDLTCRAVEEATATLRRLYATPADGTLAAMDARARRFPKSLAFFLNLRDQACRTAYCDAAVRHHDHIEDWANGGATTAENGQCLCEYCNYAKQAPGWTATPVTSDPDARDGPHEVETRLPTGHATRSRAPAVPRPARHRPARDRPARDRPAEPERQPIVLEMYRPMPEATLEWAPAR